jgi:hypothetical protein
MNRSVPKDALFHVIVVASTQGRCAVSLAIGLLRRSVLHHSSQQPPLDDIIR